jgi:hypothetical protein
MGFFTKEIPMSFKNYKKGLKRTEDQALENSRHLFANYKLPGKTYNPWWNRQASGLGGLPRQ